MTTIEKLCATLRAMDTTAVTTMELLDACLEAVPEATPPDVIHALKQVAREDAEHAEELRLYGRCRRAGIRGVVDGGR